MAAEWIRSALDIILIVLVIAGLVQATRLIWHLAGLRASRAEMERFVRDFNAIVIRAETGIKNLKSAARETGDDLERLLDKSFGVRDELMFLVESADKLAERLSVAATATSGLARGEPKPEARKPAPAPAEAAKPASPFVPEPLIASLAAEEPAAKTAPVTPIASRRETEPKLSSRAEKELMQALKKLN